LINKIKIVAGKLIPYTRVSEPRGARSHLASSKNLWQDAFTEGVAVHRGVTQVLDDVKGWTAVRLDEGAHDRDVWHDSLLRHSLVIVRHRQPWLSGKHDTGCDRQQMARALETAGQRWAWPSPPDSRFLKGLNFIRGMQLGRWLFFFIILLVFPCFSIRRLRQLMFGDKRNAQCLCFCMYILHLSRLNVYSRWALQSWWHKHMYAYVKRFGKDYAEKSLRTSLVVGNATVNVVSTTPLLTLAQQCRR
jgi:hypothetical protein